MKKFQFRLQTALDMRQRREEQLTAELAQAREREQAEVARLEAMLDAREEAIRSAAAGRVGRIEPEETQTRERHLASLDDAIARQREILELAQSETRRKLAQVVEASQETRALENLRERHHRDHRREELREEQKFLDELASTRAARGMAGAS